jgi:hypothetical protein
MAGIACIMLQDLFHSVVMQDKEEELFIQAVILGVK